MVHTSHTETLAPAPHGGDSDEAVHHESDGIVSRMGEELTLRVHLKRPHSERLRFHLEFIALTFPVMGSFTMVLA